MSVRLNNENRLTSWKEIAVFLDCDVRTCHRYEKEYGLPVHRIAGKSKSRVYAYKNELELWMQERSQNWRNSQSKKVKKSKRWLIPALMVGVAIVAAVFFLLVSSGSDGEPFDFHIELSELIVLNKNGKELWRFDTGLEDLKDEKFYRDHFQYKRDAPIDELRYRFMPYLIIKDINNDGFLELIFAPRRVNSTKVSSLYCLSNRGKVLWEIPAGQTIRYGKEIFIDYNISGMDLFDLNDDGFLETVFHSHAVNRFPTRICVVDYTGIKISEYWNSGHVSDLTAVDLNGDGTKELLIGGQNNGYKKPCFIVLDPYNMGGGSPQQGDPYTTSPDLEKGKEKYYLLLPKTDVEIIKSINSNVGLIEIRGHNQIRLETGYGVMYKINFQLEPITLVLGHIFMTLHNDLNRKGTISSDYNDPSYTKKLLEGILYFNGETFVSTPAMSNPW